MPKQSLEHSRGNKGYVKNPIPWSSAHIQEFRTKRGGFQGTTSHPTSLNSGMFTSLVIEPLINTPR